MKVEQLEPLPKHKRPFHKSQIKNIPEQPGCYVLATFDKTVLYVGLTNNLNRRITEHLDNAEKIRSTKYGRAIWFFWLENTDVKCIERTWQNIHSQFEGRLPILNKISSPVSA